MPPLSLLSLAAFAEQEGVTVEVLDAHVLKLTAREVYDYVRSARPKWVGCTVMTATAYAAHKIAKIAKAAAPGCKVVFGGVHAEAMPVEALSNSAVDFVVRGDGEATLLRMVQGEDPAELKGVSYRSGLRVVDNPAAAVLMDLDEYPMPAYHLVPMEKYYPAIGAYRRLPAINMLMTRGCPGKCTFCNSAQTTLRSRSPERTVDEIEHLRDHLGIREIQFYDDTFTATKKNVFRFCELMVERDVGVGWVAFIRADCFSEKMARAMKDAGCHQVLIGIESAVPEIQKSLGKPIRLDRIRDCVRHAKAVGLDVRGSFVVGSVGETVDTLEQSYRFALDLDMEIVQFNVNTPYPGTRLFAWAKERGRLVTEDWSEYELSRFLLDLETITGDEVMDFYVNSHRRYYKRPRAMLRQITRLRSVGHVVDAARAFSYIVLRRKIGARGEVRADWAHLEKPDLLDLSLESEADACRLTFQLRQPAPAPG